MREKYINLLTKRCNTVQLYQLGLFIATIAKHSLVTNGYFNNPLEDDSDDIDVIL